MRSTIHYVRSQEGSWEIALKRTGRISCLHDSQRGFLADTDGPIYLGQAGAIEPACRGERPDICTSTRRLHHLKREDGGQQRPLVDPWDVSWAFYWLS